MKHGRAKIVLITGAGSGIGFALADVFSSHGDRVIAVGRRRGPLEKLRRRILQRGDAVDIISTDITRESSVQSLIKRILRMYGRVDVLVNNAGVTYFKDLRTTTVKEFDEVIDTNLRAPFLLTKAVLPGFLRREKGLILNILSFAAKTTYPLSGVYTASKAGAEALMNVLRAEYRARGLKIVNVYPGAVETPMWSRKHRDKMSRDMMSPLEVAEMIYQAASNSESLMVEEIVIRPQIGDLTV